MSKQKPTPFKTWQSNHANGIEKKYQRIAGSELNISKDLKPSAFKLLYCMRAHSNGKQRFSFPKSVYEYYGFTTPTFLTARERLIEAGFIKTVASRKHQFRENEYEFSCDWKPK